MSGALAQLGSILDGLQARVAELERRAGVPVGAAPSAAAAAPPAGGAGAAAAADDDELAPQVREFDELVANFGQAIERISADIGGDVAKLVSPRGLRSRGCSARSALPARAGAGGAPASVRLAAGGQG
jgi:hypothetical protein